MNATPLISVLIPAYNHERYIGDCVRSVMTQDWARMELLIVDDGSTDGTWQRIQELANEAQKSGKFERVEIATQENRGTCETLNRLCSMARGDVIATIASDDMYLPGALSALMKPLQEDEAVGVVVGQNELMDSEGRRCFWDEARDIHYDTEGVRYATFNQFLEKETGVNANSERFGKYEELLKANHIANGYLIRRSSLDRVLPFRKEAPLEDHWLHLQLSKICKYRSIDAHTFCYRWHAMNTIRQSAKISRYRAMMFKYEYDCAMRSGNARWIEAVQKILRSERIVFSLFGLIEVRRVREVDASRRFLRIGKWSFLFHERKFFE